MKRACVLVLGLFMVASPLDALAAALGLSDCPATQDGSRRSAAAYAPAVPSQPCPSSRLDMEAAVDESEGEESPWDMPLGLDVTDLDGHPFPRIPDSLSGPFRRSSEPRSRWLASPLRC